MKKNQNPVENQFARINELRSSVKCIVKASGTLNQAVKALQGLEASQGVALAGLGISKFTLKNVLEAWSNGLKIIDETGRDALALYLPEQVKVSITTAEGSVKEVNCYERIEGKKGVKYSALKTRTLQAVSEWTPALIIEGLVQSMELEQAELEARLAVAHAKEVLASAPYYKQTDKSAEGIQVITFMPAK